MHLKNDLQRDVFNRDLGVVHSVADARAMLTVRYPPRGSSKGRPHLVQYELQELGKQLQHAWAVTVHKVRHALVAAHARITFVV